MYGLKAKAYAKINLSLDVVGKRDDGYHEVEMVMQSVNLCDEISFLPSSEVSLVVSDPLLPTDGRNLILKTAMLFRERCRVKSGVRIFLKKMIPVGAGLGGGSADAAATLLALNRLWDVNLPLHTLKELAVRIGADVSFCLTGGTALARGIGEKLTLLPPLPPVRVLLAKPPFSVSTPEVYRSLCLSPADRHPDTRRVVELITKGDIWSVTNWWGNLLEKVTLKRYPEVAETMKYLAGYGFPVRMSGSGPTIFALIPDPEDKNYINQNNLSVIKRRLTEKDWWSYEGRFACEGVEILSLGKRDEYGEKTIGPNQTG